jgi:hypothetical protein
VNHGHINHQDFIVRRYRWIEKLHLRILDFECFNHSEGQEMGAIMPAPENARKKI